MTDIRVLTVGENEAGLRTDRFLAEKLPEFSRSYLQDLAAEGRIRILEKPVKSSRKLAAGETVEIEIPEMEVPEILPEKMDLDILYEDADVLVVNKPKGMTVHPAPGHSTGTLVNGIMDYCGSGLSGINGVLRPGIVHRIDKDTTGSLVICKNDAAHRSVAQQLQDHTVTRRYRGIVTGNLKDDSGTITGNIGRSTRDRKKMAVVREGGKRAVTHYRVLERFGNYTYCEFRLETGRTHQIRVHMASIGHPLLGDEVYGGSRKGFPEAEGQTLHAMVIGFRHPSDGRYIECTAPLPAYFEEILNRLRNERERR